MNRSLKERTALLRAIAVFAVVGAACLTRPVETWQPSLKTTFTSVIHSQSVDKLDLLFMIDNSASMGDKQALLAQAVPDMINRLVSPNCVDAMGKTIGPSTAAKCTTGKLEFPPVHDMHLGIITSSLGGRGGAMTCDPTVMNPANMAVNAHNDDQAHLINRQLAGGMETPVAKAGSPLNFLAWYPTVAANGPNNPPPPVPAETVVGDPMTAGTLIGDFTAMISGVQEHGCGFEAQNEAWYRFLVQPDPFSSIQIASAMPGLPPVASLQGYDSVILQQRKAFLRPDSLLAIIVVTDENEEVADPLSVGGEGYLYEGSGWPNSPSTGAPEGTMECKNNPLDASCTSCAFSNVVKDTTNFPTRCPNDPPAGVQGYLDPGDDSINVRFFHQKQRFGVFAGYPLSRYIRGLTSASVPDRAHEVQPGSGTYVGDQDMYANCINPIFATSLPTDATVPANLCNLTRGPRTPDLVYYAAIAGVPHQLLQAKPGDPECATGTPAADCPQKNQLAESDWLAITGKDPENYDFGGADFHMLESEDPRPTMPGGTVACGPTAADNCDPINGREWNTAKGDLQFSCIFQLAPPKDCSLPQYADACDCYDGPGAMNPNGKPICAKAAGAYTATQTYGKAYPSVREMVVAHQMANQASGIQGIASSLCPIHTTASGPTDPVFGYRPAVNAIIDRLKNALSVQCLPQKLKLDAATNTVPCLILVTLQKGGCNGAGLSLPPPDVLSRFQAAQHADWLTSCGGKTSCVLQDASTLTTCALTELTPKSNGGADFQGGDCSGSPDPGWCYVEGAAAGSCSQQILFTTNEPPQGATVTLQCLEQATTVAGP
ncbi:MAG TPA: hypothetical protein VN894_01420 [Polyangiaceae bacterium]|nr:hypothetical protein [Polyangiaceae bacterium]